jgi:dynein heavy chain
LSLGSVAAGNLAGWVHAQVEYYDVCKDIAPKRAAKEEAEANLKILNDTLDIKRASLAEILANVAQINKQRQSAEDNKRDLIQRKELCEAQLKRADALITGLGGEKARWKEESDKLGDAYVNVTGDILLSAGVIAYMGAFTAAYREDAVNEWSSLLKSKNIQCSQNFSLEETLGNDSSLLFLIA